ncbi:hypothetical protein UFOVP191_23 [uncultured Caudovirales phage]|uniref:Uncharacterized protein n=1 Tax=uncultured Caudovirales phage TaxID=2100421 RepID=A0A6J7WGE6_9CAUD|nr:hypothetical protein UFOVP191_23 [uncultured Caudovirales phage]
MKKNVEKLFKEIIEEFGNRIDKLGVSKRKVCEVADIHENTFYNMTNPTISTLNSIETALVKLEAKK